MTSSRAKAVVGLGLAIAIGWLGVSFLSLYTAPDHSEEFRTPTLAFLRGGLAQDSQAISRMDVSPEALRWVLDRSRRDPEMLRALVSDLHSTGTRRHRDYRWVTFEARGLTRCGPDPLSVHFSGLPKSVRIESVESGCDASDLHDRK